jgi:hypothetical protein
MWLNNSKSRCQLHGAIVVAPRVRVFRLRDSWGVAAETMSVTELVIITGQKDSQYTPSGQRRCRPSAGRATFLTIWVSLC